MLYDSWKSFLHLLKPYGELFTKLKQLEAVKRNKSSTNQIGSSKTGGSKQIQIQPELKKCHRRSTRNLQSQQKHVDF